jgi:hypothetical protein
VEGEVTVQGREYFLTNIRYGNINSSNKDQVKGEIVRGSTEVTYEFPDFRGYNPNTEKLNVRQWYMNTGATDWQFNSEYKQDNDSKRQVVKRNALIYLVLDQSNSIGANDVPEIRRAVKSFIQTLYDAYR